MPWMKMGQLWNALRFLIYGWEVVRGYRQRWSWDLKAYMLLSNTPMPADLTSTSQSPQEWPVNGTLDLHLFQPKEVGDLVQEYLAESQKRGILQVRIIHGKGTGQLRERVHVILRRIPEVASFGLAPAGMGGWGATVVELKPH